jgi:hypothetical protein
VFLDYFDVMMLIFFLNKKNYFDPFSCEKHFEK